jgi:hypothetical protein
LVWEHPQTERFLRRFASYGRLIFFDAFLTCAGFQDDASFLAAARLRIRRWVEFQVGGLLVAEKPGSAAVVQITKCSGMPPEVRGCSRVAWVGWLRRLAWLVASAGSWLGGAVAGSHVAAGPRRPGGLQYGRQDRGGQ